MSLISEIVFETKLIDAVSLVKLLNASSQIYVNSFKTFLDSLCQDMSSVILFGACIDGVVLRDK